MNGDQLESAITKILVDSGIRYDTVKVWARDLFISLMDYDKIEPVKKHIEKYVADHNLAIVVHVNLKAGESLGLRRTLRNF